MSVAFGHAPAADWAPATVAVAWLAELTATAVKPKPLAKTAELATTTHMRVRMTFMIQPSRRSLGREPKTLASITWRPIIVL
jgi:hypothetical protein